MQVTDVLSAVLVGLLIGVLGRLALPGRQRIGIFVTLLIGVGSALLGTLVADALNINDRAPASFAGVDWDWIELAIQVGFAIVGTALAAALTHTAITHHEKPQRRRSTTRRSKG
jgi:uncharacterized membrane protein YeaQ/YmgE (transglycosylase-associated protein family)